MLIKKLNLHIEEKVDVPNNDLIKTPKIFLNLHRILQEQGSMLNT